MPNLLPDWMPWIHPAGRLIWFSLAFVIGVGIVFFMMRRPRSDDPTTWAQAMAGSIGTLVLMTLAYGVIPHEWITFADAYLGWDKTTFLIQTYPVDITMLAVRDIVAGGIYVVMLGINVFIFVKWQQRPTRAEVAEAAESEGETEVTGKSRFGRPIRAKAKA